MRLESILDMDKHLVHSIFRRITTEPKALLLYSTSKDKKGFPLPAIEIAEKLINTYNLDLNSFHCLGPDAIGGYFKRSLRPIVRKIKMENKRAGRKIVDSFKLDFSDPIYKNIGEIAGHALYSSAELSKKLNETKSLTELIGGSHGKEFHSSSPGSIAIILSILNRFIRLDARDLKKMTGLSGEQIKIQLNHLDKAGYIEWSNHPKKIEYRLKKPVRVEEIAKRETSKIKDCYLLIFSLLEKNSYLSSSDLKDIKMAFSQGIVQTALSRLYELKSLDKIVPMGEARILYKGRKRVEIFEEPIIKAIQGDTSLLREPTKEQVYAAINNYKNFRRNS